MILGLASAAFNGPAKQQSGKSKRVRAVLLASVRHGDSADPLCVGSLWFMPIAPTRKHLHLRSRDLLRNLRDASAA